MPADDLVHFVVAAVARAPLSVFRVTTRGTGSAQYPPRLMLALLIDCYANGIFSSRRIARATYRDMGVRYVTANTQPDHDTVCKFRREHRQAIPESFVQALLLAKELKLLRVGRVSVDGTKVSANASQRRRIRYDRAVSLREQWRGEVADLLAAAARADGQEKTDPQQLPARLARRERLALQLDGACAHLAREAKERVEQEPAASERPVAAPAKRRGRGPGRSTKPPDDTPSPTAQTNLADADRSLMRQNKHSAYRQADNAQAVVDADGSQWVLGVRISRGASDRHE